MPKPTPESQAHPTTTARSRTTLLVQFAEYCKDYLRLRPATCQAYTSDVRSLQAWLAASPPTKELDEASPDDLREYLQAQGHLSNATVARRIHAFSSFFGFLSTVGLRSDDPSADLRTPKVRKAVVTFVTDDDLLPMLKACRGLQERAMLLTLAHSGLRRGELVTLDQGNVDLDERRLIVRHGKGDKDRIVPLVDELVCALRAHLLSRPQSSTDAVFVGRNGHRLTQTTLQRTFRRWLRDAGLGSRNYTLHSLRHGAATRWLRAGLNIRDVQILLGHESIETTARYIHSDLDLIARELDTKAPTIAGQVESGNAVLPPDVQAGLALLGRLCQGGPFAPSVMPGDARTPEVE